MANEYFSCKCDEGNSRCSEIKGKDRLTRTPPCGFCGRVTLSSSNYVFCSHKHVFKGFSLFERDDWRFCCHKKTSFEFSLPSIIAHFLKKHHCSSSSLHLSSTKKKLWLVAYRSSSHTSGMYILCSCSQRNTYFLLFLPFCCKTSCVRITNIKNVENSG